jgi:hypothetical protein
MTIVPKNLQNLVCWSDCCVSQNKNSILASALLKVSSHVSMTITSKYLEPGHTHMECDTIHGLIEKQKKKTEIPIYEPKDWYTMVRTCRSKKPLNVIEMGVDAPFYNFGSLVSGDDSLLFAPKFSTENKKSHWNAMRSISYKPELLQLLVSDNVCSEENLRSLVFAKTSKTGSTKTTDLQSCHLPIISNTNDISVLKKKDLMCLLQFLPNYVHKFYFDLTTSSNAVDFVD